ANNTEYGLAGYVFKNDLSIAWRIAEGSEARIFGLNEPVPGIPQCPLAGLREFAMGRELAHEGLAAYLETRYVSMCVLRWGGRGRWGCVGRGVCTGFSVLRAKIETEPLNTFIGKSLPRGLRTW